MIGDNGLHAEGDIPVHVEVEEIVLKTGSAAGVVFSDDRSATHITAADKVTATEQITAKSPSVHKQQASDLHL